MDSIYSINAIYPTFNGEQNPWGIGSPTLFIRFQGCHIRCYLKTLGTLCDTPEALDKEGGKMYSLERLLIEVNDFRTRTGIGQICISGGDPLWRKAADMIPLIDALLENSFRVTVETSGTISIKSYLDFTRYSTSPIVLETSLSFIVDYKLQSAGLAPNMASVAFEKFGHLLRKIDYIKFVVYDLNDFEEFLRVFYSLRNRQPTIVVGAYWGGKLSTFELFDLLSEKSVLDEVHMNMQAHKFASVGMPQLDFPKLI